MFAEILMSALRKIKRNFRSFLLASIGIVLSSFITLFILSSSHTAKDILVAVLCEKFPALRVATVRISDEKYALSLEETLQLSNEPCVRSVMFRSATPVIAQIDPDSSVQLYGIYGMPESVWISEGTALSESDFLKPDCMKIMIHEDLANKLFGAAQLAVGKNVIVCANTGKSYTYIINGIYRNTAQEYAAPNMIYGSYQTITTLYGLTDCITKFTVQAESYELLTDMKMSLSTILRSRYKLDAYEYRIMTADFITGIQTIINLISSIFIIFTSVIILVSSINIRNVLLSIMEEYTHFIGVQKAIGAKESIIIAEYLTMSVLISVCSTCLSIILFALLSNIFNSVIHNLLVFCAKSWSMEQLAQQNFSMSVIGIDIAFSLLLPCTIVVLCCFRAIRSAVKMKITDALSF